jgi:Trk-type K+ transport system membrane component
LSFFDAVCAAFATISTGGFAIYNDNLGFYM